MKPGRTGFRLALAAATLSAAACDHMPGRPGPGSEVSRPGDVLDFDVLYSHNCAGCHGAGGKGGAAVALNDPVYLAYAPDEAIRRATANGVPGTPMPPFADSAGGMLTGRQIDALVAGMRQRWARPGALAGEAPPPYRSDAAGDASRGDAAYRVFCASCHGPDGSGGKAHSIVDSSYLALASDQGLRTTVVVGVPSIVADGKPAAPDWRGDVPGRPMTGDEVSDVVAWLAAHRTRRPAASEAGASNPAMGVSP